MQVPKGQKPGRIRPGKIEDRKHLDYVRSLPCCCCGRMPTTAHHLIGSYDGKGPVRGWSLKAGDDFAIPLCHEGHIILHDVKGNEESFLESHGINGLELAKELWEASHAKD